MVSYSWNNKAGRSVNTPAINGQRTSDMNYCDMKGLIWPVLFCVFVICVLPVLLVDNARYCKQSIVPCYPWTTPE